MGTGSAMAHRAVDSVMGPRHVVTEHVSSEAPAAASAGAPVQREALADFRSRRSL